MRHRITTVMVGCCFLASPACAETLLHLSDTETLMLAPDELAASLRAEAISTSATDAQQRVNAAMWDALARARCWRNHRHDGRLHNVAHLCHGTKQGGPLAGEPVAGF